MTKQEQIEISELKNRITTLKVIIVFAVLAMIFVEVLLTFTPLKRETRNYIDGLKEGARVAVDLKANLFDEIADKCGSTFLVKQPFIHPTYWTVYKQICTTDGFCKYEYIKLEDCLK